MFSSRKANNLINRIHERSIRIVSGDNESNFENLLEKNKEITIHQRNLQVLMTEVFKIINGYTPPIMDNFFIFRGNTYGSETISYRTPLFWANIPEEYKLADSLSEFKSKKKTWKCDTCMCLSIMPIFPSKFRFYLNTLLRLTASNN